MDQMNPGTCGCPDAFIAGILTHLPGNWVITCCTRCGEVTFADAMTSEDRPHDVQFHGFRQEPLPADLKAWLDDCPRYWDINYKRFYLAPHVRFATVEERDAALAKATQEQAGHTLRDILLDLGMPANEPPALPQILAGLVEHWRGLRLDDSTPLDELLAAGMKWNGPTILAKEVLARRSDLLPLAVALLSDGDPERRASGRYLVKAFHLEGEEILAPLRKLLATLDGKEGVREVEFLDELLRGMPIHAASSMLPDLKATAARIEKGNYYPHKSLMELCARFSGTYEKIGALADRIETESEASGPEMRKWIETGLLPMLRHIVANCGPIPNLGYIVGKAEAELHGGAPMLSLLGELAALTKK